MALVDDILQLLDLILREHLCEVRMQLLFALLMVECTIDRSCCFGLFFDALVVHLLIHSWPALAWHLQ